MATTRRDFLRTMGCTLGSMALASSLENFGLVGALAQTASDYRALVCIFLNGGNDGNNMIVPLDDYASYSAVRNASGLAIPQASLLPINPQRGRQFGLHPNMTDMQALFNRGKLAVLCNTGPLVEPLTRATYQNGTGRKPLQLFSHSDQVGQWSTSIADAVSQTGWAGRTADRAASLNGAATFPQAVSIAGVNLFVTGANTRPLAIADANTALANVLPINNAPNSSGFTTAQANARRAAFNELRDFDTDFQLIKSASEARTSAVQTSATLSGVAFRQFATQFPGTSLGAQLMQVARLIALRDTLGMKRQIFFCQIGGFDTHANQRTAGGQDGLLTQVSQAMKAFYDATIELGVEPNVTTFTLSDFGRTLQSSGSGAQVGSDHGWGNHHFVMGGSVRGGDFYGTFPTLAPGGPDDTDTRGRWIPTTSVEQYAATLATWYGLSTADLSAVFPLIGRFSTPNLGFML